MKGKKLKNMVNVVLILFALISLIACEAQSHTADMRITLEKEVSRTYAPNDVNLTITNYQITCTGPDNQQHDYNTSRNTFVLEGLPVGQWNITAEGRNAEGLSLVRGTTTFDLNPTNTNATVVLNELIGTGDISLTYTWDSSLIKSPRLVVTVKGTDNSVNKTSEPTPASGSAVLTLSQQPAGSYTVNAALYDGTVLVAGAVDAVRVIGSKTTTGTISLNLDEAPSVAGHLTLENKVGTPVDCIISGISNGEVVTAQREMTLSLDTQSINIDDVNVEWYLDGSLISSTSSATIKPAPGKHRLDIIAKTKMLGSTGSTQINFEAAVLGAPGQPILAGEISNGAIKIGGRTNVDFLPDGKVLVVSDTTKTASICSIIRNTLVLDNSVQLSKAIKKVKVLNTGNIVTMISDTDNSAIRWTYDKNAAQIINPINCLGNMYYNSATPKFEEIYDIIPPSSYNTNYFSVIGYGDNATYMSMRHLTNSVTEPNKSNNFVASGKFLGYNSGVKYSLVASDYDGERIAAIDPTTGKAAASIVTNGTFKTKYFQDNQLIGASAIAIMNNPSTSAIRFVAAVGDKFVVCKGDSTNGVSVLATINRTAEGLGLNTCYMFTSKNGKYLYALNSGNTSISTYKLLADDIEYVAKTELSFSPQRAVIANSGAYMFITGNNASSILMMKIKTTETN